MSDIVAVFLLALLGSIIALVGGVVFLFSQRWSKQLEKHSVPFAAGVLLTISLLGLLPEALEFAGEAVFTIVLFSFLGAYLFEHIICRIHHHDHHQHHGTKYESSVPLVIVGDTIHNFIDGVAIAAAYFVNPGLGLITAISTFLHEVPHEIGDFGILLKAGWKRNSILIVNAVSASATILGAFLVLFFSQNAILIGVLLAISAGLFLYLGASDFLPHIEEDAKSPLKAVLPLIIGVIIMLGALFAIPHTHETQEQNEQGIDNHYSSGETTHSKVYFSTGIFLTSFRCLNISAFICSTSSPAAGYKRPMNESLFRS